MQSELCEDRQPRAEKKCWSGMRDCLEFSPANNHLWNLAESFKLFGPHSSNNNYDKNETSLSPPPAPHPTTAMGITITKQGLPCTRHHLLADTELRAFSTSSYLILTTPPGRTEAQGGLVAFLGGEVSGLCQTAFNPMHPTASFMF